MISPKKQGFWCSLNVLWIPYKWSGFCPFRAGRAIWWAPAVAVPSWIERLKCGVLFCNPDVCACTVVELETDHHTAPIPSLSYMSLQLIMCKLVRPQNYNNNWLLCPHLVLTLYVLVTSKTLNQPCTLSFSGENTKNV